jgi:large subunit ribosomal protein L21
LQNLHRVIKLCGDGKGKKMFAIIKSGGRQYKVSVGEKLQVNRLVVEEGDQVRFEEVLLISDAENVMVGTPLVSDALVLATATEQGRGEKLIVFKYKSKKRYRHRRGHRQELTFLTIDDIVADGKSLVTGEAPEFREKGASAEEEEEITEAETGEAEETLTAEESAEEAAQPEPEKKTRRRRTTKAEESEE